MRMQPNHHHHFFDTWCDFLCFLEASLPLLAFAADLILSSRLGLSDRGTTAELEKARWSHSNGARTGLLDRSIPELPLLPLCGLEWNRVYFPAEWSPRNAIGKNNNLAHSRIQNATKHSTPSTLRAITQTPTRAGKTEVCREPQSAKYLNYLISWGEKRRLQWAEYIRRWLTHSYVPHNSDGCKDPITRESAYSKHSDENLGQHACKTKLDRKLWRDLQRTSAGRG